MVNITEVTEELPVDSRAATFLVTMALIYLLTCAIGTAILTLASRWKNVEEQQPLRKSAHDQEVRPSVHGRSSQGLAEVIDPEGPSVSIQRASTRQTLLKQQPSSTGPVARGQRLSVAAAFAGTFLACLGVTLHSMQAGLLTKETGLAWEGYLVLFSTGCLWQLVQAVAAAVVLPRGRCYPLKTFFVATMSGIWPVLSDSYDTMKDEGFQSCNVVSGMDVDAFISLAHECDFAADLPLSRHAAF